MKHTAIWFFKELLVCNDNRFMNIIVLHSSVPQKFISSLTVYFRNTVKPVGSFSKCLSKACLELGRLWIKIYSSLKYIHQSLKIYTSLVRKSVQRWDSLFPSLPKRLFRWTPQPRGRQRCRDCRQLGRTDSQDQQIVDVAVTEKISWGLYDHYRFHHQTARDFL